MTTQQTKIFDIATGEVIERDMTADEIANFVNVQAEAQAEIDAKNAEIAAQESAIAKLKAIGLTADEIAALKK